MVPCPPTCTNVAYICQRCRHLHTLCGLPITWQGRWGSPSEYPDRAAAASLPMATQVSMKNALAFLVTCGASTQSIGLGSSCSPSLTSQPRDAGLSLASAPPEVS